MERSPYLDKPLRTAEQARADIEAARRSSAGFALIYRDGKVEYVQGTDLGGTEDACWEAVGDMSEPGEIVGIAAIVPVADEEALEEHWREMNPSAARDLDKDTFADMRLDAEIDAEMEGY